MRNDVRAPRHALISVALFVVAYFAVLLLASLAKAAVPPTWGQLVWGLASSALLLVVILLILKHEGRPADSVGLGVDRGSLVRFFGGVLLGFAAYGLNIATVTLLIGSIHFSRVAIPDARVLAMTVCTYLSLAMMEELGLRSYLLRTLDSRLGWGWAIVLVGAVTGLSHIAFGWPWQTVLLGVVPAAFLFAAAALASRGLAMPIGLHAAVNISRWVAGETETPGVWKLAFEENAKGRLSIWAPAIGVVVFTLFALALVYWHVRHRPAPTLALEEAADARVV